MPDDHTTDDELRDRVVAAVRRETETGLGDVLRMRSFDLVGPFAERGALLDRPHAVVQWRFVGIDCLAGFNGMWPTAKEVVVTGVTIVDTSAEPWTYRRHVDWNSVNSQLGGSRGRSSTHDEIFGVDDVATATAKRFD